MKKLKVKSVFISDVHLGTKDCKAQFLEDFLKHVDCHELFMVGDIIDGWRIQQKKWHWNKKYSSLVRRILKMSQEGVRVNYITGNHDEFLRPYVGMFSLASINILNHAEYRSIDGERFLVVHGDMFDGITRLAPWIGFLGDKVYDSLLWMNNHFNFWRHRFGFGYWSLSKYLKHRVKKAIDFIFKFEKNITTYAKKRGFDGVICGHIHSAEIKTIDDVTYMNTGDWVESCTALVEHLDGRWEVIHYHQFLPSLPQDL